MNRTYLFIVRGFRDKDGKNCQESWISILVEKTELALGIAMSTGIVANDFNMIQAMPFFFHGIGLVVVMFIAIMTGWGRRFKNKEAEMEEHAITGE